MENCKKKYFLFYFVFEGLADLDNLLATLFKENNSSQTLNCSIDIHHCNCSHAINKKSNNKRDLGRLKKTFLE